MGKELTIWHNPRCSKSREALAILEGEGAAVAVREYLKEPPTADEIKAVLRKLGIAAAELVRRGEAPYAELGLATADEGGLLEAMAAHPILIERPVVIGTEKAVVGRPPERVRELL